MVRKKSHMEFMRELETRNSRITVLGEYKNNISKIAVKCDECGWEWFPTANSLLQKHGCPKCAGVKLKSHAEFAADLKSKRDDVIIVGRYVRALQKTKFKFLKCGHEWDITPAHILSGRGCPVCARSRRGASQRLTMDFFSERLHRIDPNLTVRKGETYINNRTPVSLRCKACGHKFKISPHAVLNTRGCPNCHRACTSFFEQFIFHTFARVLGESEVLSRDRIAIGAELDIYIPGLKAAIEPGSWYWHKNQVARDREKQLRCKNEGIRLIIIYDHYDAATPPFDDCIVTSCDLTSRRNVDKLVEITRTLFAEFGLDLNLGKSEWTEIKKKARTDSKRMTTEEFKTELFKINPKIEIVGNYTSANDRIKARCKTCSHEWHVTPTSLRSGSGCPQCAGVLRITHSQFVERLNSLQPDISPITAYTNNNTRMRFECKVCGYTWSTQPYHLIAKSGKRTGCPKCSQKARRTQDEFIAEIARLSPAIKITGSYVNLKTPISVQCNECGRIWDAYPGNLLKGCGCKNCKLRRTIRQRIKKVKRITTGEISKGNPR